MIKTFVGGQIIKEFLRTVSDVILHDNKNIISKVCSSRFIAVRLRVLETSGSVKYESSNESDTKQLAIFMESTWISIELKG
jgi:hypothetical protein